MVESLLKQKVKCRDDVSEFFSDVPMSTFYKHMHLLMTEHDLNTHDIVLSMDGDYDSCYPVIVYERLETNEELIERINKERKNAARREKDRAKRHKKYLELRFEFEG